MWRKPNDPKPSQQPANSPGPAAAQAKVAAPVAPPVVEPQPPAPLPVAQEPVQHVPPPPPPVIPAPVTKMVSRDSSNSAVSRIGSGLKIRGELSGNADLVVDGELQGKIALADSKVTVGNGGRVQADIEARDIVIEGSVQGNLKAHESVHLTQSSHVQGSVLTPRIGIDDGARLRGKVEMVRVSEIGTSSTSSAKKSASESEAQPVQARGKEA